MSMLHTQGSPRMARTEGGGGFPSPGRLAQLAQPGMAQSSRLGHVPDVGIFPSSKRVALGCGGFADAWDAEGPRAWGNDGSPAVSAQKLPPLGVSRSAPVLSATDMVRLQHATAPIAAQYAWRDGPGASPAKGRGPKVPFDALRATEGASWPVFGAPDTARTDRTDQTGSTAGGHRLSSKQIRGGGNKQKWTLSQSRAYREAVLQKDRLQARTYWYDGPSRQVCSPARSHAAQLFFSSCQGGDEASSFLPAGALRHVARPQTRAMHTMPNSEVHIQMQSTILEQKRKAAGAPNRASINTDDAAGARDATLSFDNHELLTLRRAVDSFANFVPLPPGTNADEDKTDNLGGSGNLRRSSAQSKSSSEQREIMSPSPGLKGEPLLLRPLFCRFLLSSKLCGTNSPPLHFHECITAFDRRSLQMGAFCVTARSDVVAIIAGLISPEEETDGAPAASPQPGSSMFMGRRPSVQNDMLSALRARFFKQELPLALTHLESRKERVQERVDRIMPKRPLSEGSEGASASGMPKAKPPSRQKAAEEEPPQVTWPPLPPCSVPPEEIPAWLQGFRQWVAETGAQDAERLLDLRAKTETLLRGEVLSSQLLEPEVLHFATRFTPLFARLFNEYADHKVLLPSDDLAPYQAMAGAVSSPLTQHMSFAAFFHFAVDFGLFPDHASFAELRHIYDEAETVLKTTPRSASASQLTCSKPGSRLGGRRESASQGSRRSSQLDVKGLNNKTEVKSAAALKRKAAERAATAARAEAEAQAGSVVELAFLDKPVASLNDFEIRATSFLAAVDDWLVEKCVRLPEVIRTEPYGERDPRRLSKGALGLSRCSKDESDMGHSAPTIPTIVTTAPQIPATIKRVSAAKLLEVLSQMTGGRDVGKAAETLPSEEEVENIFRLLLADGGARLTAESATLAIDSFQLDKAMRKAREARDRCAVGSCMLLREKDPEPANRFLPDAQMQRDTAARKFIQALDAALFERSRWDGGAVEDIFGSHDTDSVTPEQLVELAGRLGAKPEDMPQSGPMALLRLVAQLGGSADGSSISRNEAWRMLAMAQEKRRSNKLKTHRTRLACLAHSNAAAGPKEGTCFGLSAFVECLLKCALHGLYSKGSSDLQRTAPNWWKCTWLLTLFSGKFAEQQRILKYEESVFGMCRPTEGRMASNEPPVPEVSTTLPPTPSQSVTRKESLKSQTSGTSKEGAKQKAQPTGSPTKTTKDKPKESRRQSRTMMQEAEVNMRADMQTARELRRWWERIRTQKLYRYMPPLERLAVEEPNLFDPQLAEAPAPASESGTAPCELCKETRSPNGWGSPFCILCSGVEEACVPFEDHLFAKLIKHGTLPEEVLSRQGSKTLLEEEQSQVTGSLVPSRRGSIAGKA